MGLPGSPVEAPEQKITSLANWGSLLWFTLADSHFVYRADLTALEMASVAESGRGYPSSIDANATSVAWTEWVPKPGRHSSWRVMTQTATGDLPTSLVDEATDTRTGSLYDLSSVLDLNGDAIAYTAGAPTTENPLASAIRYGDLTHDEPFHEFETDLVPFDIAIGPSGVLYSMGAVNPDAFGEIIDPKLMIYGAGSDAPQPVAEVAFHVALDGDRMVWTAPNAVFTASVGSTEQTSLTDSAIDASLPIAAAEGLVTWSEATSDGRHALLVWDSESGAAYQVAASDSPFVTSIGGGWLAWSAGESVDAVSLEELRGAF